MATVETSAAINTYQLSVELGSVGIRVVGPDHEGVSRVSTDDVSQDALDAAVAAHVADPSITPPPAPPIRTTEDRIADARELLSEAASLPSPTTPADLADILARAAEALNGGA